MISFLALVPIIGANACSNLLIPAGSSQDGSTIISYSADAENLYGDVSHWPARDHVKGTMREIWDWDTGRHLGAIPEVEHTYNVVGNTNEHQLSISETTFGGLEILSGGGGDGSGDNARAVCDERFGCIDYGQLIWVTLQRARTVREAISTIDHLMQTYGYASSGESFSIADPQEVWLMEIIGKGNFSRGALWVATKVPDGYVGGHANQARIRTFPKDDPEHWKYSKDVISFAREHAIYNGSDEAFSFSDVYDPVTFEGARFCEARVFSFFSSVAAPEERIEQYLDYAQGYNLTNRMPLFVKTNKRLTVNDTMWHMRNHYEGTWFDSRFDVGAGKFSSPYRLGMGLTWDYAGKKYVNERPIGTQYAGWNVIMNQRPKERYSIMWWGPDDSTFSPHTPFYGATSRVPQSFSGSNCTGISWCREKAGLPGTITKFSMKSMHWITQMVANFAYSSYAAVSAAVQKKLVDHEAAMFKAVAAMDKKIIQDAAQSRDIATEFSYKESEKLHELWSEFYGELFMTYVDGYKTVLDPKDPYCGCQKQTLGWGEEEKASIAAQAGKKYHVPETSLGAQPTRFASISKVSLRAMGGKVRQDRCPGSEPQEEDRVVV